MLITQKNQYAIRAVFELAKRRDQGLTKIADIAAAQKIPDRYLEVILVQLKRSGIVASKRGCYGASSLKRTPDKLTAGVILRYMETDSALHWISCIDNDDCVLKCSCAFLPLWIEAQRAMLDVLDRTTIQTLMDNQTL